MIYAFERVEVKGDRLFVLFSQKARDGTVQELTVCAHEFMSGEFNRDHHIKSPEIAKAAGQVIGHDYTFPERKLA